MGQRDKTQGFGFMYVDISKILLERKNSAQNVTSETPVMTDNVKHANFNKDAPLPKATLTTLVADQKAEAIRQVKANLDRLQTLHHKLHSMLDELSRVNDSKNKKS